jgi:nudix-type nucleoside diphosphatase (YffH/AdpP family)
MDVTAEILDKTIVHSGWNRLITVTARTSRGAKISRSVEDHGAAAAVLPFDPVRRTAILVRQLRVPVLLAQGTDHFLEVPAGIVDTDDPAACARREVMEEAGLALRSLIAVVPAFPMPGVSTEILHLFLGEYGDGDRVAEGGGLACESEEIEVVELALCDLAAAADRGALRDLKTLALVQTLRLRQPDLFQSPDQTGAVEI